MKEQGLKYLNNLKDVLEILNNGLKDYLRKKLIMNLKLKKLRIS